MKDKTKKYDLSYFIKDGGRAKDTSPSVNASEMNEEEMKRRNNNLNRELREMEQQETEARNEEIIIEIENPEQANSPVQNNENNNNENNENNENGNLGESSAKPKSEEEINAAIAASEIRLEQLMSQFALESHKNRPKFDTTLDNINSSGAAATNAAFELNSRRRSIQENASEKRKRDATRLAKTGEAEGLEANKAARSRAKSNPALTSQKKNASSAPKPTKEEIADDFFELVATSDRASFLNRNQLQQFSQNPIDYVVWARDTLLTPQQRKNLRRTNITPEELLTRLPRNLQKLFEQTRRERTTLNALQIVRLEKSPELSVLGSDSEKHKKFKLVLLKPVNPPNIPAEEEKASEAQQSLKVNVEPISVKPIIVSTRGDQLPPNHQESFNANKSKIKNEDKEKTKPSSIKKKQMSPENIQKKINNEAKQLSNQANQLDQLHTQKILRNKKKIETKIEEKIKEKKFKNWDKIEYINYLLDELKDETDKPKIIGLILELEKLIKEKETEKSIINNDAQSENSNKIKNSKARWAKLPSIGEFRLKGLTIPKLLKKLNKTPPDQEEEIEELTSLITELKDKELKDKELKYEELRKNLKNMNNSKKVSEEYENEIELLKKARENKKEREEELRKNLKNMNYAKKVSENYKNEIERLKKARENKKEREEEERIREEEEEKERSRDPKEILKKIKEQQERILGNKMAREKQIKALEKNETLTELRAKSKGFIKLTPKEIRSLEDKEQKIEELKKEQGKLEKKSKELLQEINKLKSEKKSKQKNRSVDEQKQEEINIEISKKNSRLIDQILNTQQRLYKAVTEEEKSELRKIKTELFKEIESNKKGNSHRYLKEVRETISKGFKKLNLQNLKAKYAELFNKGEETIKSNNKNKKLSLQKEVDNLLMKLYTDSDYDKTNRKMLINKYKNFVNSKEIEHKSTKFKKNIENSKKQIQEKYNTESEEKNLFKRYLKNSLSLVDEKNKDKLEKLYKKLNTEEIKIFPKTKKKYLELINKYKKIEEMKVKKLNRTTNELATPNIKQVQKFKPKPEISPWDKKAIKNTSSILTNKVKPTKQTFPKDSQNSSPIKKNSNFTRVPYKTEEKIIKLIKKLPSRTIKIKDIKSEISSIENKEIQRQLRSLLDQKLNSITRK